MMNRALFMRALLVAGVLIGSPGCREKDKREEEAPMTTDLGGRSARVATASVYRLFCPKKRSAGTAFLHKSGKIITVGHVVEGANPPNIVLLGSDGGRIDVRSMIIDENLDLALLTPKQKIKAPALQITSKQEFSIGMQVSAWGYPAGYRGTRPLLVSGCLSGVDSERTPGGKPARRWVVNAAFNSGNSGGPLVDIETGQVMGVVSSKLAPLPAEVESALNLLKTQRSGLSYTKKTADGTMERFSEAQLLEAVLQYLRSQTQLVIGYAVMTQDLKKFLKAQGIKP